jgi:hypothetical protein
MIWLLGVVLVGGVIALALKSGGDICPRCSHWQRDYPMCSHPWHFEEETE